MNFGFGAAPAGGGQGAPAPFGAAPAATAPKAGGGPFAPFGTAPASGDGKAPAFGAAPAQGDAKAPGFGGFGKAPAQGDAKAPGFGGFGKAPAQGDAKAPAVGGFGAAPAQGDAKAPAQGDAKAPGFGGFGKAPAQGDAKAPGFGGFGKAPAQGDAKAPAVGGFGAPPAQGDAKAPGFGGFGKAPAQGDAKAPAVGGFGAAPAQGDAKAPAQGDGKAPGFGGFGAAPAQGDAKAPAVGGFGAAPAQGDGKDPAFGATAASGAIGASAPAKPQGVTKEAQEQFSGKSFTKIIRELLARIAEDRKQFDRLAAAVATRDQEINFRLADYLEANELIKVVVDNQRQMTSQLESCERKQASITTLLDGFNKDISEKFEKWQSTSTRGPNGVPTGRPDPYQGGMGNQYFLNAPFLRNNEPSSASSAQANLAASAKDSYNHNDQQRFDAYGDVLTLFDTHNLYQDKLEELVVQETRMKSKLTNHSEHAQIIAALEEQFRLTDALNTMMNELDSKITALIG